MVTTNLEKGMSHGYFKKERSAPYQLSKERCKADEDESDQSLSSQEHHSLPSHSSIHATRLPWARLKMHKMQFINPSLGDRMRYKRPLLCSVLFLLLCVTRCIHVTLHVALHLLNVKKKKWYGYNTYTPNGEWDDVTERMLRSFTEGGHPVFRGTSALERSTFRSKGGEKTVFSLLWRSTNCWSCFSPYYFPQ